MLLILLEHFQRVQDRCHTILPAKPLFQFCSVCGRHRFGCSGDIALLTHIYVTASAGVVESWLLGEIERTPEQLVAFADQMLGDHIRGAQLR